METGIGARYHERTREFRDQETGCRVLQLTDHPSINHHLYFLTPSLTPDEGALVFASYRTGRCEYFMRRFPEGETVQITDEEGVHGYSGLITPGGRRLLYTAGGAVRAVDLEGLTAETLADYPGGQLGECSLSADGRWVVTAIKRGGRSGLTVTATDGTG